MHPTPSSTYVMPDDDLDETLVPRPWWSTMHVIEFRAKLPTLTFAELVALREEVGGTIASLTTQIETRGRDNFDWWCRARSAIGFSFEKRHAVQAQLVLRKHEDALQAVFDCRGKLVAVSHKLDSGDINGARDMIDKISNRLAGLR